MTSLSEQLKRLAVPQTSLLKDSKKRPSLLFNPREAALLTRDTAFEIGVNGFEELKSKNPVFAQYENNLFHYTSKEFERAVQSKEANEKLNKNIARFFMHLSPYFMLYDAHKAMEWLINRFRVHEYNKEDLLLLILPYHETNIFVRTLQLINVKDPADKWHWLHVLQKSGVRLPKDALYNHAATDYNFLKLISKQIIALSKEHENSSLLTVAFNFYCATFVGAITHAKEVNENHVTQMLPSILKGLKSDIPDFCASAYVITSQLMTKTTLSEKLLLKIVDCLTEFPVSFLLSEATALMIVIYQCQKEFCAISEEALNKICEQPEITKILQKFDEDNMHIEPFVRIVLREAFAGAIENDNNSYQSFTINLLNDLKLGDDFVPDIIRYEIYLCYLYI